MESSRIPPYTRRSFLKLTGGVVGATLLPSWAPAGTNTPWVRQDLATLSSSSSTIQTLINGIQTFKNLDSSDPNNRAAWHKIANVHNNFCAHQNWYFLPWHRPYVGYFEYLIQQVTGVSNFALPYWNWTKSPRIPPLFLNTNSVLYDSTRQVNPPTQTIQNGWVDPTTMAGIMSQSSFSNFAGTQSSDQWNRQSFGGLEATPHNNVHNWINGDMGNFTSPLDPLFWMHHCNIDRLWAVWNVKYQNTTNSTWLNYGLQYGDFPNWSVSSTLSTTAMGYTYDNRTTVT
jgi:tyrosinase